MIQNRPISVVMKIPLLVLITLCSQLYPLTATPDHAVSVTERFLGSNSTGFVVLRTEIDNLSSYYSSRNTTWLDEIPKTVDGREKTKSTLLLDVTDSVDIDHTDRNTPAPVTESINSQDASLTLASILQKYPDHLGTSWTPEQLSKLTIDQVGGIHFNGKLYFIDGTFIQKTIFGDRHGEELWALSEVSEDSDCIYLRLSIGNDSGPESRIVCVPPDVTKRQRDQSTAQPVYLIAGKFKTREEAVQAARIMVTKAKGKKFYGFYPEIWSFEDGTLKTQYVVADSFSTERIIRGGIPEMEKTLEIHLTPMSSDHFIERTLVPN